MNLANIRRMKTLFAAGKTDREIGAEIGHHPDHVRRTRHEHGLKRTEPLPRLRTAPRATVVQLATEGKSDVEIGAVLGITPRTIARLRREGGIKMPHGVRRTTERRKKPIPEPHLSLMVAARKHGWSWNRIAAQWKIAPYRAKREIGRVLGVNHA